VGNRSTFWVRAVTSAGLRLAEATIEHELNPQSPTSVDDRVDL